MRNILGSLLGFALCLGVLLAGGLLWLAVTGFAWIVRAACRRRPKGAERGL